jgi:hypothetical protein
MVPASSPKAERIVGNECHVGTANRGAANPSIEKFDIDF